MKHMTHTCAAAVLAALSSDAVAQERPLTTTMSCHQAQSLVATQGAVFSAQAPQPTNDTYHRGHTAVLVKCQDLPGPEQAMSPNVRLALAVLVSVVVGDVA